MGFLGLNVLNKIKIFYYSICISNEYIKFINKEVFMFCVIDLLFR